MKEKLALENYYIAKHIRLCEELGTCNQCKYPWNDGICSCTNGIVFKPDPEYYDKITYWDLISTLYSGLSSLEEKIKIKHNEDLSNLKIRINDLINGL